MIYSTMRHVETNQVVLMLSGALLSVTLAGMATPASAGRRTPLSEKVLISAATQPQNRSTEQQDKKYPDPSVSGSPAPPASTDLSLAIKWVDALRRRDVKAIVELTHFPFALRDTRKEGDCINAIAADRGKMKAAIACLINDQLLDEDLKNNPEPEAKVASKKSIPGWAKRWVKEMPTGTTPVSVFIHGNGSSFEFILLVTADGVQAFWKTAWFESN